MSALSENSHKPITLSTKDWNENSINNITYSEIKSFGTAGARSMFVNYDNKPWALQTPKMRLPYGLSKFQEPGKAPKYNIDLSFVGMDENPKLKKFFDILQSIDEKIVSDCQKKENTLNWMKKKTISEDVVRTLYTTSIKRAKDKETGEFTDKYPPTFKAKMNYWEGVFKDVVVYDHNGEKIENTDESYEQSLAKGQNCKAIVKCGGIWFSGGKFGVTWKVALVKVDEPRGFTGYAFRDDGSSDEEVEDSD